MGLGIVEPVIPVANRIAVVRTRAVLARLALGGDALVVVIVERAGKHDAREQQRLAVRVPARRSRPGRKRRHPLRLPALGDVQHVNLADFVALAPRDEGDAPAVGTPRHVALARLGRGQTAGLVAAVRRDDPQIRRLVLRVIGRLDDREHDRLAVRTERGRADPLHEPDVFMGDGLFGRGVLRGRAGRKGQGREKKEYAQRRHAATKMSHGRMLRNEDVIRERAVYESTPKKSNCPYLIAASSHSMRMIVRFVR